MKKNASKSLLFRIARESAELKKRRSKKMARKKSTRRRTKAKSRRRPSARGKTHRPVLTRRAGRWYRPKRSKLFRRPTRINPAFNVNLKRIFSQANLLSLFSIFFGLAAAAKLNRFLVGSNGVLTGLVSNASAKQWIRRLSGFAHIAIGGVVTSKARNQYVRNAGTGMAAMGVYDLVTQNFNGLLPDALKLQTLEGIDVGGYNLELGYMHGSNINMDRPFNVMNGLPPSSVLPQSFQQRTNILPARDEEMSLSEALMSSAG